ncbi:glucose-6-phosphate isomerase [Actinomadura rubrobrunea]|uniref:glucose-6-phosphate isomerase n=2 Tax=Actinomadura rubrobrunea TaxID=115335 RepID=A0A9W6PS59_9ACTN|nr:glucose-6-phosphate isomerase [Actinomadura rubrobrunea]
MPEFATAPISPMRITLDVAAATVDPAGPVLTRRMSDLEGLFADRTEWKRAVEDDADPVVYTVSSSPVPEIDRELPQSITTIRPGTCGGEFFMTKGHQHPNPQGEIYLGLSGVGGLLLFDGQRTEWIDMAPGVIGYIPPHWAHRSVNVGDEPYSFLAVYPGCAGHDYQWVLEHGMGARVMRAPSGYELVPFQR